jgi:hypothetical protein
MTLPRSIVLLQARETAQGSRLRDVALESAGFTALLFGSMSVAATSFSTALRTGATTSQIHTHGIMTALSDTQAIQEMLRQLHAIVYGYQLALGHLSESSPTGKRALAGLAESRMLGDRLEQLLVSRSAAVPAAAPAYVPPIQPTTAAKSAELIKLMEIALGPFCGLWLASATLSSDRLLAFDSLSTATASALSWRAPLNPWPGWPS